MNKSGYCESMWRRWSGVPARQLTSPSGFFHRDLWLRQRQAELDRALLRLDGFRQDAEEWITCYPDAKDELDARLSRMWRTLSAERDWLTSVRWAAPWEQVYSFRDLVDAKTEAYQRGRQDVLDWVIYFAINGAAIAITVVMLRWIMG